MINEIMANKDLKPNDMATMRNLYTTHSKSRPPFCVVRSECEGNHHWHTGCNSCSSLLDVKIAVWRKIRNDSFQRGINRTLDKDNFNAEGRYHDKRKARCADKHYLLEILLNTSSLARETTK